MLQMVSVWRAVFEGIQSEHEYEKETNLISTSPKFPVNAPSINSSVFANCKIIK